MRYRPVLGVIRPAFLLLTPVCVLLGIAVAYASGVPVDWTASAVAMVGAVAAHISVNSRALIYGPGPALLWVLALFLFEIFLSRRAWCRYVCPIGLTYGLVGTVSPVRVQHNMQSCHHEGDCRKICMVPHVLDVTIRGRAKALDTDIGDD